MRSQNFDRFQGGERRAQERAAAAAAAAAAQEEMQKLQLAVRLSASNWPLQHCGIAGIGWLRWLHTCTPTVRTHTTAHRPLCA